MSRYNNRTLSIERNILHKFLAAELNPGQIITDFRCNSINQANSSAIVKIAAFKGDSITLGAAMLDGEAINGLQVKVPLRTLNRHGLIAVATGSGKTKTLQIIAEQLSAKGVPVLLMDIKGDLSGIAAPGATNPKIEERHLKIGEPFVPGISPVEFLSLSEEKGARLRATVTEFGPVLFSKILDLNDTQGGVVAVVCKYCDDNKLPLVNLADFKKVLQYITGPGKEEIQGEYGQVSSATVGIIMRKIIELEHQGAETFFGERSFDPGDLCRFDESGKGIVSVIRLTDIQDRPKLFSTFMLQLLAEIYSTFPEEGDLDQPKLCIVIEEAHLVLMRKLPKPCSTRSKPSCASFVPKAWACFLSPKALPTSPAG